MDRIGHSSSKTFIFYFNNPFYKWAIGGSAVQVLQHKRIIPGELTTVRREKDALIAQ